MKNLIIIGAGETASLAYEYFTNDSDYNIIAFAISEKFILDNQNMFLNLPLISLENLQNIFNRYDYEIFVAISGDKLGYYRKSIYDFLKNKGYKFASYISSNSFVWKNVEIGENCFIMPNNVLHPFCKIGNNVIIWGSNDIGHRSIIRDHCCITSNVVVAGYCDIGEHTFIGINSSISDGLKIAKDNFITLGSTITSNTCENKIYRGNPARALKIPAKKFLKIKI
ncbi:acetyltransferase [Campylobacter lari]|nr:acetyltransferase [Campylobacter lari]HEC1756110.1 acetyltransferase [Campylobacter lari]